MNSAKWCTRTHEHKNWTSLLDHDMKLRTQGLVHSNPTVAPSVVLHAKLVIAGKFGRIVKQKMKSKAFSCRKTINNMIAPPPLRVWDTNWGSRLVCLLCRRPAIYECIYCRTCNAIAHRFCVMKHRKYIISENLGHYEGHMVSHFDCAKCAQSMEDDFVYYDKCIANLREKRMQALAQQIIDQQMKTRVSRQRFVRNKAAAILIQATVRKFRSRKVFYMWRRTQLRVVRIEIMDIFPHLSHILDEHDISSDPPSCRLMEPYTSATTCNSFQIPNIGSDGIDYSLPVGVVVLTVVDPIKHLQIFRFERKLNHVAREAFLIPGVSALCQVIATVYIREPNQPPSHSTKQQMILIGQVVLALRDTKNFLLAQEYKDMEISKKITWIPMDVKDVGEGVSVDLYTQAASSYENDTRYMLCTNTTPNPNGYIYLDPLPVGGGGGGEQPNPLRSSIITSFPGKMKTRISFTGANDGCIEERGQLSVDTSFVSSSSSHGLFSPITSVGKTEKFDENGKVSSGTRKCITNGNNLPSIGKMDTSNSKRRPSTASNSRQRSSAVLPNGKMNERISFNSVTNSNNAAMKSRPSTASNVSRLPLNDSKEYISRASWALSSGGSRPMVANMSKNDIAIFLQDRKKTCTIKYIPLNPISNMCINVKGPPIDVLRKDVVVSKRVTNKMVELQVTQNERQKRQTNYWLCLTDLWLYFYTEYGDISAKLMSDVKDAKVSVEKGKPNVLIINHSDTRKWSLEFEDDFKANKFLFAIEESQNAYHNGDSIYIKPPRSVDLKPYGFTCPVK